MAERARDAVLLCKDCDGGKDATPILDGYEKRLKEIEEDIKKAREWGLPQNWPTGFDGLPPLRPDQRVLECDDGGGCKSGNNDFTLKWPATLLESKPKTISIHFKPSSSIGQLISVASKCQKWD